MKILYVTTISDTVNAFLIPHIKVLINKGYKVDVAFNIMQKLKPEITEMGCKIHALEFQRSPFKKDNYQAYKKLKKIILEEDYDIVHTHTPIASTCVRLACRKMKNIKVFYTSHGLRFFKGAPIISWLLYYPIESILSRYTDVMITINKEDYERSKVLFNSVKVYHIPGVGLDVNKYHKTHINKMIKRKTIGLPRDAFVMLSVGELNKNKNHKVVIKALAELNNPQVHYIICGEGLLDGYLKNLIDNLGLEKQVHLLGFRNDVREIYKLSDLFVLPSKREGLNVSLMEAMASGLPVVCSDIRGNKELIENGKGGFLVNYDDVHGFADRCFKIIKNKNLRNLMCKRNFEVIQKYDKQFVKDHIIKIHNSYLSIPEFSMALGSDINDT